MTIDFTIPAIPVAQPRQRHRVMQIAGKAISTNYAPRHPVDGYKATVRHAATVAYAGAPLEGPLFLEVVFVFPRPKLPKKAGNGRLPHCKKPDVDNLLKSLCDSLNGLLFGDDRQIASAMVRKVIAAADEQPHVEVKLSEATSV